MCCPPAQGYFAAHTLSLKACKGTDSDCALNKQVEANSALQARLALEAESAKYRVHSLRLSAVKHLAHDPTTSVRKQLQAPHLPLQILAVVFLVALQAGNKSEKNGKEGDAHQIAVENVVCV